MTVEEFRQFILKSVFDEEGGEVKEYVLTEEDWKNNRGNFQTEISNMGMELRKIS